MKITQITKKAIASVTKTNTRKYLLFSSLMGLAIGAAIIGSLFKLTNQKVYAIILIGIGCCFFSMILGGIYGYIKDRKEDKEITPSNLAQIINEISKEILSEKKDEIIKGEKLQYKNTMGVITEKLQQGGLKNYKSLNGDQKKQLQGIIFGKIYLDWKYPSGIKMQSVYTAGTSIEINMDDIEDNEDKHMTESIVCAAFISKEIDDITHANYDQQIKKLNIRYITKCNNGESKDYKANIIGKMKQYMEIKKILCKRSTTMDGVENLTPTTAQEIY